MDAHVRVWETASVRAIINVRTIVKWVVMLHVSIAAKQIAVTRVTVHAKMNVLVQLPERILLHHL